VTLVVAVKMPRLSLSLVSRAVKLDAKRAREREREKGHDRVLSLYRVAPTRVSLRSPSSFVVTLHGRGDVGSSLLSRGLQIACQLNHNRDSGSRDNLASGYHGVSLP